MPTKQKKEIKSKDWLYGEVKAQSLDGKSRQVLLDTSSASGQRLILYIADRPNNSVNSNYAFTNKEGKSVVCRHLADHFMRHHSHKSTTPYTALQPLPRDLWHNNFDQQRHAYRADHYDLFDIDDPSSLGELLHSRALALLPEQTLHFALFSENHAMSLIMRMKSGRKQPRYVVKFYDPNKTYRHIRLICNHPDMLKQVNLNHFISDRLLNIYFPKHSFAALAEYRQLPNLAQSRPSVSTWERKHPLRDLRALESLLKHSLTYGLDRMTQQLTHCALYVADPTHGLNSQRALEALSATDAKGAPGLHLALYEGHPITTTNYMTQIIHSRLTIEQKKHLLAAKNKKGHPALTNALYFGKSRAVTAYINAILSSPLPPTEKTDLLSAKDPTGTAGLFFTLKNGHTEIAELFTDHVLSSNLPSAQKTTLLLAKDTQGTSGLNAAFKNGHDKTVAKFCSQIVTSYLPLLPMTQLLSARDADGIPGLSYALENKHTETVRFFILAILHSRLVKQKKFSLLSCKNLNGDSGLIHPIMHQNKTVLKVFAISIASVAGLPFFNELMVHTYLPSDCQDYLLTLAKPDPTSYRFFATSRTEPLTMSKADDKPPPGFEHLAACR